MVIMDSETEHGGTRLVIVPDYVHERLTKLLDEQIALCPEAAPERDFLWNQLLDHFDRTGTIPSFTLERRPSSVEPPLMARTSLRRRQGYHKPRQDSLGRLEGHPDFGKPEVKEQHEVTRETYRGDDNGRVWKNPVSRENDDGSTTISVGFPVCDMHDTVGKEAAHTIAELLNRGEKYEAEKARAESAEAVAQPLQQAWDSYGNAPQGKLDLLRGCLGIWNFKDANDHFLKSEPQND